MFGLHRIQFYLAWFRQVYTGFSLFSLVQTGLPRIQFYLVWFGQVYTGFNLIQFGLDRFTQDSVLFSLVWTGLYRIQFYLVWFRQVYTGFSLVQTGLYRIQFYLVQFRQVSMQLYMECILCINNTSYIISRTNDFLMRVRTGVSV